MAVAVGIAVGSAGQHDRERLQGLLLDLADALRAQAEPAADLAERERLVAAQTEAERHDLPRPLGQLRERLVQLLLVGRGRRLLEDVRIRDQLLAQRPDVTVSCRPVQAHDDAARERVSHTPDAAHGQPGGRCELLLGGRPAVPLLEPALCRLDAPPCLAYVEGHADLPGRAPVDRLTDPPARVRREAAAATPVEPLDRDDEPDHAVLDQIVEGKIAAVAVPAGQRDDEPEVRGDHPLAGRGVALLDPLCELDLLHGRQQGIAGGGGEEDLKGVQVAVRRVGNRGQFRLGFDLRLPADHCRSFAHFRDCTQIGPKWSIRISWVLLGSI